MAVYDCFTFFNEMELLELRLKLLNSVVDRFVLVELDVNHRGVPKPYNYLREKLRFRKYAEKIFYVQATDAPKYDESMRYYYSDGMESDGDWSVEHYQRNCIMDGLRHLNPEPDDYIMISDLDEIPSPDVVRALPDVPHLENEPISLAEDHFNYFLNCRYVGSWYGTVICKYKNLVMPQPLRDSRNKLPHIGPHAGWHFSYLGGVEKIKAKLNSIVDGNDRLAQDEYIEKCLNEGVDLCQRDFKFEFIPMREIGIGGIDLFIAKYPHLYRAVN
jgi:beta-1,4-mannosyl-glycoprotein beta-1,4-N-acetylglucosaminyltransferase